MKRILFLATLLLPLATSALFGDEEVSEADGYVEETQMQDCSLFWGGGSSSALHFDFERARITTRFGGVPQFDGKCWALGSNNPPQAQWIILPRIAPNSFYSKSFTFCQSKRGSFWVGHYFVDFDYPLGDGQQKLRIKVIKVAIGKDQEGNPFSMYAFYTKEADSQSFAEHLTQSR